MNPSNAVPKPVTPRVLVVDDSTDDRTLLANFLHSQGFRTYIADDGADGYEKAKVIRPDMVLMDIAMPVCDGLAACGRLKADKSTADIPLIFLTASTAPAERVSGLMAGAIDYITKPFDFDEVRLRLAMHMRLDAGAAKHPHGEQHDIPLLDTATGTDVTLFRNVQAIVRDHLQDTPDLATLALAMGVSARRLTLAFRRCVGLTVSDYVREERLRNARRLLTETTSPISAIAASVGYGGGANFSTAFRERFGVTPTALRRDGLAPVTRHVGFSC